MRCRRCGLPRCGRAVNSVATKLRCLLARLAAPLLLLPESAARNCKPQPEEATFLQLPPQLWIPSKRLRRCLNDLLRMICLLTHLQGHLCLEAEGQDRLSVAFANFACSEYRQSVISDRKLRSILFGLGPDQAAQRRVVLCRKRGPRRLSLASVFASNP